jgi:hypothetical protein
LNHDKRNAYEQLYKGLDNLRKKYGEDSIGAATPRNRAG